MLDKNQLLLTKHGKSGNYILKPIPRDLKKVDQLPANEHLTMQIAKQVYGINTAENALIFLKDGAPAYITKRFDVKETGDRWGIEDFATIAGKTKDNAGINFKYMYSYEEAALLIQKFVPAWSVEIENYFVLIVFNFLFSNSDAHLKNFSLLESSGGDYLLSRAYDLINTRLHVDDSDFALDKGLFADNFKSKDYLKFGHPSKTVFVEFAGQIGLVQTRSAKLLNPFTTKQPFVENLVSHFFLTDANKRGYQLNYRTKLNYLNK